MGSPDETFFNNRSTLGPSCCTAPSPDDPQLASEPGIDWEADMFAGLKRLEASWAQSAKNSCPSQEDPDGNRTSPLSEMPSETSGVSDGNGQGTEDVPTSDGSDAGWESATEERIDRLEAEQARCHTQAAKIAELHAMVEELQKSSIPQETYRKRLERAESDRLRLGQELADTQMRVEQLEEALNGMKGRLAKAESDHLVLERRHEAYQRENDARSARFETELKRQLDARASDIEKATRKANEVHRMQMAQTVQAMERRLAAVEAASQGTGSGSGGSTFTFGGGVPKSDGPGGNSHYFGFGGQGPKRSGANGFNFGGGGTYPTADDERQRQEREREEAARQEREKAQKERERQEREKEELERARKEKERLQRERQEQERQEKVRSENARRQREAQAMADAFAKYEAEWDAMHGRQLTFGTIPWPVQVPSMVRNVSDLTERGIKEFLLSEHHSKNVSAKQRIREALLRWHPDRLVTTLAMVVERDRVNVEKGANIVTGILNGL